MREKIEMLIEDYERRLKNSHDLLESTSNEDQKERLGEKAAGYIRFIHELKKLLKDEIMSELKAEQFYKDVKDFMDLEKDGFTKLTPTGISPNYESIFDFAEAYYEERKANELANKFR